MIPRFKKFSQLDLYAIGMSGIAALFVIVVNRSGVGWSWDTSDYVAVGRSFAAFDGLNDVTGMPMTVRPPGLPVLIAVGVWLKLEPQLFIQILNTICAVVVVLGSYKLLRTAIDNKIVIAVTVAFIACSPALLWQYSMIWSEPPFIAILVVAMNVTLRKMTPVKFAMMSFLMVALFFIRFVGPVFAVAMVCSATLVNRRHLGLIKSGATNFAALAISGIPIWLWLMRNKRIDGTLTGARAPAGGSFFAPTKTFISTIGSWVIGNPVEGGVFLSSADYPLSTKIAGSLLVVAVFGMVLYVVTLFIKRKFSLDSIPDVLILSWLMTVLYGGFSVYRFVHWEFGPLDNRMMIPIFVPLIIIIAVQIGFIKFKVINHVAFAICIALLGLQINTASRDAIKFGDNGRYWSDSNFQNQPIHLFVKALPANSLLLSNMPQQVFAVWSHPPIFTQYQLDFTRGRTCSKRFYVWYPSTYNDGTANLEGQPRNAEQVFSDASGTVFDLGNCNNDIEQYWE